MRLLMRRVSLVCACVAACAIFQSDWRLEPSPIGTDRATLPAVQIPDTVMAGVPETVVVWTKGGGCKRRAVPSRPTTSSRLSASSIQLSFGCGTTRRAQPSHGWLAERR